MRQTHGLSVSWVSTCSSGPVNTQWLNAFKQEGSVINHYFHYKHLDFDDVEVKLGELEDFQINAINDKLHRSYNVTYGVQAPS
ncbi:hypothetical protein F2Q69_00044555 [Brassica cretica]|uniref:Uncharacterized protein n=1 Tax=Brassica cretica TaxID=69181 RepID=A0A8S9NEP1_BRACR|nr:hypothetical protein F2Q69_00044555 [Brassica cretica]